MRQRVYLETSIIGYLAARPSRDLVLVAHQAVTRQWWDDRRKLFDVYVSQIVLDEAARGDDEAARRRLDLLLEVPRLRVSEEAIALGRALVETHAIPRESAEDAFHIAIAAVNGMDYLLTWNCRHIANAELIPAICETIEQRDYDAPIICTPNELMGAEP